MTLEAIEQLLAESLRNVAGREVVVRAGPVAPLPLGGMQETIFVHAARFEDHGGADRDGARIGRRPVRRGRVAGVAEERPARIVIEVWTMATAYARVQALSRLTSPAVLLTLASEEAFVLSESANRLVSLTFTDFSASLHRAETGRTQDDDVAYHTGRQVFHLEGVLHVIVSRQDGLRRPSDLVTGLLSGGLEPPAPAPPRKKSTAGKTAARKKKPR